MGVKVIGFIDLQQFEPSVSRGAKIFLKELRLHEEERQQRELDEYLQRELDEEIQEIWIEKYYEQFN